MAELTFEQFLPEFATELETVLRAQGRSDMALQVRRLPLVDRCRCGDDFCATFYTAPKPNRAYGAGHANVEVGTADGMLVLDLVYDEIRCIEVLHRPDVRKALLTVFP